MTCNEICLKFKAVKSTKKNTRYALGQKRCNACGVFMEWEGITCPCCGSKLRTRPRGSRYRTKMMQEVKRF